MRAVLDPNVIISAALSPHGSPARLLLLWLRGSFDLIASPALIAEVERVIRYPKIRDRLSRQDATELVDLLLRHAILVEDGDPNSIRSPDAGDDCLIALAESNSAALVSGDKHLLDLEEDLPIYRPNEFLRILDS